MMRIAIDADSLEGLPRTGVGRYLSNLIAYWGERPSEHEFCLYWRDRCPDDVDTGVARVSWQHVPVPKWLKRANEALANALWKQVLLPSHIRRDGADVIFSPSYIAPLVLARRTAVAIHDVSYIVHPEWFGRRFAMGVTPFAIQSARRCGAVLAISEFSRSEIVRWCRVSAERVEVIPAAADTSFGQPVSPDELARVRSIYGITRDYVLFLGTAFKRRCLPELVQAFAKTAKTNPGRWQLVLCGRDASPESESVPTLAAELGIEKDIVRVQRVAEPDLNALMTGASAFVYPSQYEGFGLPVLEAMACGVPTIAGNTSSLPEVVGQSGLLVEPTDVEQIAEALTQVLTDEDLRRRLVTEGPARAAQFSWRECAAATMQALEYVGARQKSTEIAPGESRVTSP